jgi:cellulose synthase/poly-beta-1,6-N-acetylglucosamine synthase-like glycosyltransferase
LSETNSPIVDFVIPVYREEPQKVGATLSACLHQTVPISRILVVDDGSPEPVAIPEWAEHSGRVSTIRLAVNGGISAARNAGIWESKAPFVACINAEILPDDDWLASCLNYLLNHKTAGAVYTRMVPKNPNRLVSQWRMRFLEPRFAEKSGSAFFAPGHAVLFRREALSSVGGYDIRHRLHHEDSDVCIRMKKEGWETHYVAESRCVSIQEDSITLCALKELRESYWYSPSESSLLHLYLHLTKWTVIRAARNTLKMRWTLLPLDMAIWCRALWIATIRTVRYAAVSNSPPATKNYG